MTEFLSIALSLPTVFFTVPLGVVLLYWVAAIVGGLDLDFFDAADGAAEGVSDGLAELLDGAEPGMDSGLDVLDGALDAADAGEFDADLDSPSDLLLWLTSALRLGRVPVTVVVTLLVFWGWVTSFLLSYAFLHPLAGILPAFGAVLVSLVGAVLVAGGMTNLTARPLEPVFKTHRGRTNASLVSEECSIRTSRVDARFGEALVQLGGDDLVIQVRCDVANSLKRGHPAIVVHFDTKREAYLVEPLLSIKGET